MQFGPQDEIYLRPATLYVATFVGRPRMSLLEVSLLHDSGTTWLQDENFKLAVTDQLRFALADTASGASLVLGVRAEDLRVHLTEPDVTAQAGSAIIAASVVIVEPMGSDTFIELHFGSQSLVARVAPQLNFTLGQNVWVEITESSCHLFDATSEKRIEV